MSKCLRCGSEWLEGKTAPENEPLRARILDLESKLAAAEAEKGKLANSLAHSLEWKMDLDIARQKLATVEADKQAAVLAERERITEIAEEFYGLSYMEWMARYLLRKPAQLREAIRARTTQGEKP